MGIINRLWAKVWNDEEYKKGQEAEKIIAEAQIRAAELRAKHTPLQELAQKHGGPEFDQPSYYAVARNQFGQLTTAQPFNTTWGLPIGTSNQATPTVGLATTPGLYQTTQTTLGGYGWPVLGDSQRDIFFMALKGIEEASMKRPEGNHRYDDLAMALFDLRYFDGGKISLLGLASFCLSNLMEVEPLLVLLEGHGMTVVDE